MNLSENDFSNNLSILKKQVEEACEKYERELESIKIMGVTKTHDAWAVDYSVRAQLPCIGESKVQESVEKKKHANEKAYWELIGHLQSNKARLAVKTYDRIQTVDREKLIRTLNRICEEEGRKALPILLQVNTSKDPAKFGCTVEESSKLLETALNCPHIQVDGLMTIAPFDPDISIARKAFDRLFELKIQLENNFQIKMPELSMGMSHDLEAAIAAGSTMLRIGTALFGKRIYT